MGDKKHLEELSQFIREHRSNEGNFQKLYDRLVTEYNEEKAKGEVENMYLAGLEEAKEKQAEAYRQIKDTSAGAWPEFEKFVSSFEKSVTEAIKEA